jgi:hypothetical protein
MAMAREWRKLRQPVMASKRELDEIEKRERQVRFELANAALLWLWHIENPTNLAGRITPFTT